MNETIITKQVAQQRLLLIWLTFSGILTLIFFVQIVIGDKYGDQSDQVWDWFLPLVFPTLTLMIGAWQAAGKSEDASQQRVDIVFYRVTIGVIVGYFLILLAVVFSAPRAFMNSETPAFDHLKKATKLLNLIQGLVTALLGYFFFQQDKAKSAT